MGQGWPDGGDPDGPGRPETVQARKSSTRFTVHRLLQEGKVILTGAAVGDSIACGEVCVIRNAADVGIFRDGALLVTEMTDPDWVPVMKRAAGIITDHGGPTSHAAIVSRELGVPAIVGTGNATSVLNENQTVTLSAPRGTRTRLRRRRGIRFCRRRPGGSAANEDFHDGQCCQSGSSFPVVAFAGSGVGLARWNPLSPV